MNNQRIVVSLNLKRTIKIMKLTVLMLAVCLSSVVASTYAQTATLNVSAKNETLEKVLKQIEKQSEFLFFYNLEEINKNEKISISEKNANIQTVLDAIAAKTGLKYTITPVRLHHTPSGENRQRCRECRRCCCPNRNPPACPSGQKSAG